MTTQNLGQQDSVGNPGGQGLSSADHIELAQSRSAHNYSPLPVVIAEGRGAWVTDVEGRKYLDCLAGYSAMNFGHHNPDLLAAAHAQLDRVTLTSRAFYNDQFGPWVSALADMVGKQKVLPMNTGAEAVENAVKIARHATRRPGVLCFEDAFHGRTQLALSLTSKVLYKEGFGPMDGNVTRVPFAYPYRSAAGPDACTRATGPRFGLQRELAVEGLGTRIELQSDAPDTPPEGELTAVALSAEDPIELHGQATAQAGISGDWLVWVKYEDSQSRPLSEEIALGRCSQIQSRPLTVDYTTNARAVAQLVVNRCDVSSGPNITVDGQLTLDQGVIAKVILRDDQPTSGSAEQGADAVLRIQVYEPGFATGFRKQQLRSDVGGNPTIEAAFVDDQGQLIGEPRTLGTCRELASSRS